MPRVIVIGGGPAEVALTDTDGLSGAAASVWTHTGMSFGPDIGGRIVVVATMVASGFTATATIGGVAATEYRTAPGQVRFFVAAPSGASGDVVVTTSGTPTFSHVAVWALTGADSATPVDHDVATGAAPQSVTIAAEADGVVIGYASGGGASAPITGVDAEFAEFIVSFWTNGGSIAITADDPAYAVSANHGNIGAISFK